MKHVSGLCLIGFGVCGWESSHLLLLQGMEWGNRAGPSSLGFILRSLPPVQISQKFLIPGLVLKSAHVP